MDPDALLLQIQKNHPDLQMIKRVTWRNCLTGNLESWMRKNYSNEELETIVLCITKQPIGGAPMEAFVRNHLYWERKARVKKLHKRFRDEMLCTALFGTYSKELFKRFRGEILCTTANENRDNALNAAFSRLDCANEISSADDYKEVLVRNMLKITANRILEERKFNIT